MKLIKNCLRFMLILATAAQTQTLRSAEQAPHTGASIEDRVLLQRFRAAYAAEHRNGKADQVLPYYADDIRLMPPFSGTVLGKAHAARYHQAWFERFRVQEFRREPAEVIDLAGRIVECGTYTMKLARIDSGAESNLDGSYMDIWEKSARGVFLVTQVWNFSRYPAWGEELRLHDVPTVRTAMQARVPVKGGASFELAALARLHETAVVQHDGPVWAQFFADDAVLRPNFHAICDGRAAIDAYITKHVKELPVFEKLDIRNDRIDDLGRFVIEYGSHVANWRNGDSSGVNTGKNIQLWRREPSGALKIFRSIGNYD